MDEHLLAAQSFSRLVEIVPRRLAGRRRRARGGARRIAACGGSRARPDVRRDGARVLQHADRALSRLAADPDGAEGDRRAGELVRDQGLRRRACTTSGARRTTRRSSTSRTSSTKYANAPTARDAQLRLVEVVQGDPLQGRRAETVRAAAPALPERPRSRRVCCGRASCRAAAATPDSAPSRGQASRRHRRAEPCGSGSSAGASIRRTSATCSPPATRSRRWRSTGSCSCRRRRSR